MNTTTTDTLSHYLTKVTGMKSSTRRREAFQRVDIAFHITHFNIYRDMARDALRSGRHETARRWAAKARESWAPLSLWLLTGRAHS